MAQTWKLFITSWTCAVTVLSGGYAFALPHGFDTKWGHGESDRYEERGWDRDHEWGKDEKDHKYNKPDWDDFDPKLQWFLKKHDKDDGKWGDGRGMYEAKDPACDPMTPSPEPSTLLLVGSSLAAAGVTWRRRGARSA